MPAPNPSFVNTCQLSVRIDELTVFVVSNSQLFTASEDTTMRVWSAETGQVCVLDEWGLSYIFSSISHHC